MTLDSPLSGMSLPLQAPDRTAFKAFGAFLAPPEQPGERARIEEWLRPVEGCTLHTHLNRVAPVRGPMRLEQMECHLHSAQVFLPIGVSRYVVVVAPRAAGGEPDVAQARGFVVPGTMGVAYHPGTWHAGISVLDAEGSFFVAMWRGRADDDVFARIPVLNLADPAHV